VAFAPSIVASAVMVGGGIIWIPADDLDAFNANIVSTIDVVAEYR